MIESPPIPHDAPAPPGVRTRPRSPARADLALLALVAAGPIEFAFHIGKGNVITVVKLAGLLCFLAFAYETLMTGRRVKLDRSHVILLAFLAIAVASSIQARSPFDALSTTVRYGSYVGLYVVLTQFEGDHRMMRRLVWVLSISVTVAAALALTNFITQAFLIARLKYGDPNDVAYTIAVTLPLTAWLIRKGRASSYLVGLMILVMALALLASFSRGAMLALGIVLAFRVLSARRGGMKLLIAAALLLGTGMLFVRLNPDALVMGLSAKSRVAGANVNSRLEAWEAAFRLAADHPIVGIGPGNYGLYYIDSTDRPPGTFALPVAHNAYADVAAELGFPALALFLAFLIIPFSRLRVAVRARAGPPGFAFAVQSAFFVAVIGTTTVSEQYFAPIWILGALATVLWREAQPPKAPQR